jgi:O-methyltransferase
MRPVSLAHVCRLAYYLVTTPFSIFFILGSRNIHPACRLTPFRKLRLGLRMFLNVHRIPAGTSYKSHLAMALKLFEAAPDEPGLVVECETWKGGAAANLSLACRLVGRRLRIYDSFRGLPSGHAGDPEATHYRAGDYCGTLDEVKRNIERYGAIECCEFVEGWFSETLPRLSEPVLLAFVDVDLADSLDTCVCSIWPHLAERGYVFVDEFVGLDYCALFFSEKYWWTHFRRTPPGLIGTGTGLALGEYYIGPWSERDQHPLQNATGAAYMRKDFSGHWTYYPGA